MKLPLLPLPALAALLLAAPPVLAMDQRQADKGCASWKLECPQGASTPTGPAKKTGPLECKAKAPPMKQGPSVQCKDGKALAWGDWKDGKKHGLQVTMRPEGSWTEEHFQEGKKHGPERSYRADGELASETRWEQGAKAAAPKPGAQASSQPP